MFSDFDDIFKKGSKNNDKIPGVILNQLNKSLKGDLKYADIGDGFCIVSSEKEIKVGGLEFEITDDMRLYLGDDITIDSIMEYSYNTQQKIRLESKTGMISINGEEMPIKDVVKNPLGNCIEIDGEIYMLPPEFPSAFPLLLGDGEYVVSISVKRKPCNKRGWITLSTQDDSSFYVKFDLNLADNSMQCKFELNIRDLKLVKDRVKYLSVFLAWSQGNGLLNGSKLKICPEKTISSFSDGTLDFWKRVLKIEEILKIEFNVDSSELNWESSKDIESMFQMLVNKNPLRSESGVDSLTSGIDREIADDFVKDSSAGYCLVSDAVLTYNVFDQEIELPSIMVLNDLYFKEYSVVKDKIELKINNEIKKAYYSYLAFVDFKSRKEYSMDEHIKQFAEAKTIEQYIDLLVDK